MESRTTESLVVVPQWRRDFPWLWHGWSTRQGGVSLAYGAGFGVGDEQYGDLNLGFTAEDEPERVSENRLRLIEQVTSSRQTPLVVLRQVHSGVSVTLRHDERLGCEAPQADGILTDRAGVLVAVQTADCIPVLVADPVRRVVGAFHAGWRGTVQRIVERGIAQMHAEFGSAPGELVAGIGPGIGCCCYSVGVELRTRFREQFPYADALFHADAERLFLDLTEANRRQLVEAGVDGERIATVGGCTECQPERFFSYRSQQGRTGRMMSVVGIAPDAAR